jgi:hypothetical protein
MESAIRYETTITPSGRIELPIPQLRAGQQVEVIVVPCYERRAGRCIRDVLEGASRHRLYTRAQEVDDYIREERDAWER